MSTALFLTSNVTSSGPHKARLRRKGLPKTRSGCRTCRTRHVKCGEEKPSCLRCVKFGTTCDWGPVRDKEKAIPTPRPVQLLPKSLDIAPAPTHILSRPKRTVLLPKINLLAPLLPNPTKSLFNDDVERRYFEVFSSKTAFEILPSFDSGTLRQILLQACVSDPSIRHAVVALGALDRTAESFEAFGTTPFDDEGIRDSAAQHHQNALKQYMIAIQYMRAAASNSQQDIRTILLTCLVIFCFEAWDGLKENAVKQIQTGLRLIWDWREEQVNGRLLEAPSQSTTVIEEDLIRAFSRLDVQAVSFAPAEDFDERQELAMTQEGAILNQMPQVFNSVNDAEISQSAIMRRGMRFMAFKVPLPKHLPPLVMFPVNGWHGVTSSDVVAVQQSILAEILKWEGAFDPLWKRLKAKKDPNLMIAAMLKMHLKAIALALLQVCMENEGKWDDFQNTFTEVVELAEFVVSVLDTAKSSTPKFQFDIHIVIPLVMVGHKCRNRYIRRRAISMLLRNPRREGVWDSLMAGRCAEWAMQVEEACLEHGKVPVWARIHGVILQRDEKPRRANYSCEQRLSPISEELITRRTTIIW